ncbi:hypothetical protein Ddye_000498 [Dipteronia dyeriana]|uniref:Uncharacterized protein n=1 Tax=Dipteronia dyeriana TaxID=168575 RepID=A0AAD9XLU5_9ROSI|nr:hypothetical protein Ddye_000498 [Dipteronia dyeriana]
MKYVSAFLLPVLLYSLTYIAPPGKKGKVEIGEFDHFWFALQWPPSLCEGKRDSCKDVKPNFTIHGLWPTDVQGNTLKKRVLPVADCLSFHFDDDMSPLVEDLNKYWPSFLIANTNKCFWKHEWDKHGSTISKWIENGHTPEDYFKKAVKLIENRSTKISTALEPDNSYPVSEFIEAMTKITGKEIMLQCTENKLIDNMKALIEVRLCVNSDATEFINCSGEKEKPETEKSCGQGTIEIRFPGVS